jgi:hypothetical protein
VTEALLRGVDDDIRSLTSYLNTEVEGELGIKPSALRLNQRYQSKDRDIFYTSLFKGEALKGISEFLEINPIQEITKTNVGNEKFYGQDYEKLRKELLPKIRARYQDLDKTFDL